MEKNKTSEDSIKILNRRSFIIIIFGAILSLLIALRLFSLQVINFSFYKKKSVENKLSIKLTPPLRGDIYDSKKNLLAGSSSLYEFVVFKNLSKDHLHEIKKLDSLINLNLNFTNYLIFLLNSTLPNLLLLKFNYTFTNFVNSSNKPEISISTTSLILILSI